MTDTALRARRTSNGERQLIAIVIVTIGFQVVHALEHVLQTGYWLVHPTDAPWLTPWAAAGRDALAGLADGQPGSGSELLHLAGNIVFLVGLVALAALGTRDRRLDPRWLHAALLLQALHVGEHILLTVTWLAMGRALGVTTALGLIDGAVMGGVRVWAHFLLNLLATAFAVAAITPAIWPRIPRATTASPDW